MVTKNYRFADIAFTLQMQYPYLEKQCRSYEVEEPGILIAASDEEIEREDQSGVGVNGVLIGETLMRSPDKAAMLAALNGGAL